VRQGHQPRVRGMGPHASGSGLYFVADRKSIPEVVAPLGTNRWPVEDCSSVFSPTDVFHETAGTVGSSCDGAVVVYNDGIIEGSESFSSPNASGIFPTRGGWVPVT